jgi:hypothetical protein
LRLLRNNKVKIQLYTRILKSYFEVVWRCKQLLKQDKVKFNSQTLKTYFEVVRRGRQLLAFDKVNIRLSKAENLL